MRTSMQVKALVRNLSKKLNVEAEVLLRSFMMERFLERIAASRYRHSFILKGGMLIASMVGIDTRTTMDMDATIKGTALTAQETNTIIEEILRAPVIDDGVEFVLGALKRYTKRKTIPDTVYLSELFLIRPDKSLRLTSRPGILSPQRK